jgi:ATP synthase protein I
MTSSTMAIARQTRNERWDDEDGADGQGGSAVYRTLTKEEASALRARQPLLSPWRVVGAQAAVGVGAALLAALLTQRADWAWAVLYGAAVVVVPGALMARGMTSRLSRLSPVSGAAGFLFWEMVKIAVSVLMLVLAPKLVQPLSWPALLAGLALCIKVYWLALSWRGRIKG